MNKSDSFLVPKVGCLRNLRFAMREKPPDNPGVFSQQSTHCVL